MTHPQNILESYIYNLGFKDGVEFQKNNSWIECSFKEAPLEAEILFQTKAGVIHAGIRFMSKDRLNSTFYKDFRKNKIRYNVIKWRFIHE